MARVGADKNNFDTHEWFANTEEACAIVGIQLFDSLFDSLEQLTERNLSVETTTKTRGGKKSDKMHD
jgi:hypothetical protein